MPESSFERPRVPSPLRVLIVGAATQGYYQASAHEQNEAIIPRLVEVLRRWAEMPGVRLLASLDDDLLVVGQPQARPWSWYIFYEVPDLETITAMIDLIRLEEADQPRLDRYIRFEAILGRHFFPAEPGAGD